MENMAMPSARHRFAKANLPQKPKRIPTVTLTKADIIDAIHMKLGRSKAQSAELVETLLEIIKTTLANAEDVLITGFGKFCVKEKGKRRGRNPQTGKDVMLRSRRVVTFKCSGVLRDRINGEG